MSTSRRIADHDFGIAQRALESLGATFDDLAKRHRYELEDALDAHLTEEVGTGRFFGLVAGLEGAIAQEGVGFAPGERFSSYEEMAQWVKSAAEQRGFATEEVDRNEPGDVDDLRWLYVASPLGRLSFSFMGGAVGVGGPTDDVRGAPGKLARELLRAARALQDEA